MRVWRIETAVFAFINRAPSLASAVDDMTARMICEILRTAPLFVGMLSFVLSWKCRRHVVTCWHDTTCRSNFGQMGPCRRHKIEDVVAVCVGSSRHFPDFPKCVCRNILWYGSTYAQILSRTHIMLTIQLHNEFSAPQHHPPVPPTKAMGAITQNRRGHPTATP